MVKAIVTSNPVCYCYSFSVFLMNLVNLVFSLPFLYFRGFFYMYNLFVVNEDSRLGKVLLLCCSYISFNVHHII